MSRLKTFDTEMEKAWRAIRARVILGSFPDPERVSARAALELSSYGLIDLSGQDPPEGLVQLLDGGPGTAEWLGSKRGPVLFQRNRDVSSSAYKVIDLLVAPEVSLRNAALFHFAELAREGVICSFEVKKQVLDLETTVNSRPSEVNELAFCGLYDQLLLDIGLSLRGFEQSVELDFGTGVNEYLQLLMTPTVASVHQWAESNAMRTDESLDKLWNSIDDIPVKARLSEFAKLAMFVPLIPETGICRAIGQVSEETEAESTWAILEDWSTKTNCEAAQFHVICFWICNYKKIPSNKIDSFWAMIGHFCIRQQEVSQSGWSGTSITRHLAFWLNTVCVGTEAHVVAHFLMWLSGGIEQILRCKPSLDFAAIDRYAAEWVEASTAVWRVGQPRVLQSWLIYSAMFPSHQAMSIWSLPLFCGLSKHQAEIHWNDCPSSLHEAIYHTANYHAFTSNVDQFAPIQPVERHLTYASGIHQLCAEKAKWTFGLDPSGADASCGWYDTSSTMSAEQLFVTALEDGGNAKFAAIAFQAHAFFQPGIVEAVTTVFTEEENRQKFYRLSEKIRYIVSSGIAVALNRERGEASSKFAYFLVTDIESGAVPMEPSSLLEPVLTWCLAAGSFGPLQRLLLGDMQFKLKEDIITLREERTKMLALCPPWVQGQIRAALNELKSVS